MTDVEIKTGMTDEECTYWDAHFTSHPFTPGPNLLIHGIRPGSAHHKLFLSVDDGDVVNYLLTKAKDNNQTPSEVVISMARKELASV
jgi:hypothetical protein